MTEADGCPCGAPPGTTCRHPDCLMLPPPGLNLPLGIYDPSLPDHHAREVIDADAHEVTWRPVSCAAQRLTTPTNLFRRWISVTHATRREPVNEDH